MSGPRNADVIGPGAPAADAGWRRKGTYRIAIDNRPLGQRSPAFIAAAAASGILLLLTAYVVKRQIASMAFAVLAVSAAGLAGVGAVVASALIAAPFLEANARIDYPREHLAQTRTAVAFYTAFCAVMALAYFSALFAGMVIGACTVSVLVVCLYVRATIGISRV